MRSRRVVPVLAVLVAVCLAGCTSGIPVDGPEPIRSHPAATPTPVATKPALGALTFGPDGIGDLVIGHPVPAADPALALVSWNPTACQESGLAEGQPYAGLWQTTYAADPSGPLQPDPFRVGVAGGVQTGAIVGVGVNSPRIATAAGIHLLSTAADVEAAYPSAAKASFALSDVFSVAGSGSNRLDIEVVHAEVDPGFGGKVVIMSAVDGSFPPSALYGGDGGIGTCPV